MYRRLAFSLCTPRDFHAVPIYINNRNRLTYLRSLIKWLESSGYTNYYVLDNDSTYPPLLDYYGECLKDRVIKLSENAGHLAIWKHLIYLRQPLSFYVYTDSDILPVAEQSKEMVSVLYDALRNVPFAVKAGCALAIDDLPACYARRGEVQRWESQYWDKCIAKDVYHADVDTTFCLYMPMWRGVEPWGAHLRIAGECMARHLPWYEDTEQNTEENLYYEQHANSSSSWRPGNHQRLPVNEILP